MIVDHRVAELVDQPAHVDRDVEFLGAHRVGGRDLLPDFLLFLFVRHQFHPIDEKKTAKKAEEIGRAHVELQSLMRISYAVFCLKKTTHTKKKKKSQKHTQTNERNVQQ